MLKKVVPAFVVLAFCAAVLPALADDPKSGFLSFMRALYSPKSIKDITCHYPEDLAKRINDSADPAGLKQSTYRSQYLYNIKFEYDQAADENTEQLSGRGTNLAGFPVDFQVTMVKEKDGWKVREWSYQQDAYAVQQYIRAHPRGR